MVPQIKIVRTNHTTHGTYHAAVEGTDVPAELTWRSRGGSGSDVRIAGRTFTPPEARGKGIAQALVEALVEDARAEGFTVVPSCSYVAAQFRRHPEWAGLLAN